MYEVVGTGQTGGKALVMNLPQKPLVDHLGMAVEEGHSGIVAEEDRFGMALGCSEIAIEEDHFGTVVVQNWGCLAADIAVEARTRWVLEMLDWEEGRNPMIVVGSLEVAVGKAYLVDHKIVDMMRRLSH